MWGTVLRMIEERSTGQRAMITMDNLMNSCSGKSVTTAGSTDDGDILGWVLLLCWMREEGSFGYKAHCQRINPFLSYPTPTLHLVHQLRTCYIRRDVRL